MTILHLVTTRTVCTGAHTQSIAHVLVVLHASNEEHGMRCQCAPNTYDGNRHTQVKHRVKTHLPSLVENRLGS